MKRNLLFFLVSIFFSINVFGQNQSVKGKVTAKEDGQPLLGVAILGMPSGTGVLTDLDGNYEYIGNGDDSLQFTYLGYQSIILPINRRRTIDVIMATDAKLLEEVVVIGYGTIKKSDLTGSVASIKTEDIVKVQAPNAMQALQGKVSGLQILSTSGDPGANPVVRLRGVTTLNNNNPIAVIDGVITDVAQVSLLNPNDIASIEVLKDASAAAIYGSRGAAGVIIVTTKRGTDGKNVVQASIEQSFESVAKKLDVMTGREFATYLNGVTPGRFNNLDALKNTDWQSLIYNDNAPITNANLSVSGGNDKSTYYFGLGYFNQQGVIPKSALERYSAKINSTYNISNHISMGLDLSMSLNDKLNTPGVVNTALRAWPIDTPYKEDGVTFAEVNGGNPIASIFYQNSDANSLRGLGNLYASINFLKDFTFKTSYQFTLTESKGKSFGPKYFVAPLQQNEENDLSYTTASATSVIYENTLAYNKSVGKHNINAVVGYTAQDNRSEYLSGFTENLIRETELFWYLDAGQDTRDRSGNNLGRSTLLSYLGRVNYSYDSRYLLTASMRRDGSSKFGKNNRYGNFPSLAAGWNIHNEDFFSKNGVLNSLKLRASWGIIGNERIPGEAQYSLITAGQNAVFGVNEAQYPGATFNGGGNPNLRWEETTQFNVGVNASAWNDKLTVELDYYNKTTNDILVPLEPIGYSGIGAFRSIFYNAANVRNRGFEWNVNYRGNSGNIRYSVGLLGTTINNQVTDIGQGIGADSLLVGGDLGNGQQVARTAVGRPIGFFYGYNVVGVFQNAGDLDNSPSLFGQEVGDLKYQDVNGDGKITSDDRTFLGSALPKFDFGFNAELGYKAFTVSADIQGQYGNKIYNGKQAIRFATLNYEDRFNNFWSGDGSTNEHFKPSLGGTNFIPSSYFLENGSFLRLRTLTVNYRMPSNLVNRVSVQNCNVYLRATNLLTLTKFTGYSPEIGAGNATDGVIDTGIYPITRVMTVGVNANF